MNSVSQVEHAMQSVFSQANAIARETGFVQRASKLTGERFVQTLVLAWLKDPQATREALAQMAASLGVSITPQGLNDRFNESAATLLHEILERAVSQIIAADPVAIPLLQRFSAVVLLDSTVVVLPNELASVWRGCGGRTEENSQASVKLQVGLDLLGGRLAGPHLSDGRAHDAGCSLQRTELPKGALRLTDLGYFSLEVFRQHAEQEAYFLSRLEAATAVFDSEQGRLDLLTFLQERGPVVDASVELGVQYHLPVRLLAVKVSEALANERRRKLRAEAKRKGQKPSKVRLALADWTIYVTNVPIELLSLEEALTLARARWQIELLFKLWKQHGQIDEWRSQKPWAILCEVYAKLIAMVFQHWLLLLGCWQFPDRSLVKASQAVRTFAPLLTSGLSGLAPLSAVLERLQAILQLSRSRINPRKTHPNTYQRLLALDPPKVA
jgi:DDE family transposase